MISLGRFLVDTNRIKIEPESKLRHIVINSLLPYEARRLLEMMDQEAEA